MTINGHGFSEKSIAKVGGEECDTVTWSHGEIVCETPDVVGGKIT